MGDREDIELLDSKISKLKVDYEQYFMRVLKREPAKLRDEIDRLVLYYSTKNITNTSLKFKLNSVIGKYTSYKQYWTRVLRAIEEGTYYRKAEGAESLNGARQAPPEPKNGRKEAANGNGEVLEIYSKYIEARKECNEPTDGITVESLKKTIEQYKKKVEEQYKTKDVALKVYIKDGKARLSITPKGKE